MHEAGESDSSTVALIVDDDPSIRRLCRAMLEREGWRVIEAGDGEEALTQVRTHVPDVIVMDVMLPHMDGLEATRRLRADPLSEHIPIIMVSAKDDATDIIAGLGAGADEYLTKPFQAKEFQMRVRSMGRLRRAWMELQRSHETLGEQSRCLALLLDFSGTLAQTEDLEPILDKTIEVTATLTSCQRISIMLPDPEGKVLTIARSTGIEEYVAKHVVVPVGAAIAGEVFLSGEAVVINTEEEAKARRNIHETPYFASIPLVSTAMCASERTVGVLNATERFQGRPFTPQELEYLNLISNYAAAAIQTVLTRAARDEARDSIVVALAKLAEYRDNETGRHLDRMTMFCVELAEELRNEPKYAGQIDDAFLRNLKRAAPLHDIGKVAIPDAILLKPGKLTPQEIEIMRTHTVVGTETIRSVIDRVPGPAFLKMAEEIAYGHHEWFDGRGYPQGLKGEAIPLAARIAALADVYDALTTRRVYKDAMPHTQAVEIIVSHSGTQFDPAVVRAFLRRESEFERLAQDLSDSLPGQSSVSTTPDYMRLRETVLSVDD